MKYIILAVLALIAGHEYGAAKFRSRLRQQTKMIEGAVRTMNGQMMAVSRIIASIPKIAPDVPVPQPKPASDTIARGPIIRPGDTDKALASGNLAIYRNYDGEC